MQFNHYVLKSPGFNLAVKYNSFVISQLLIDKVAFVHFLIKLRLEFHNISVVNKR